MEGLGKFLAIVCLSLVIAGISQFIEQFSLLTKPFLCFLFGALIVAFYPEIRSFLDSFLGKK